MWNIAAKFNESGFADQLNRLAQAQGKAIHTTIKEQGGLLLSDIVRGTPPRGRRALAATGRQESWATQKRIGENAAMRGVRVALKYWPFLFGEDKTADSLNDPKSNRPSAELYRLMKAGKFVHAQTLLDSMNKGGSGVVARGTKELHKKLRRRGRVPWNTKAYIVASGPSIKAVVKERKAKVGLGKSGWMKGAVVLGTYGKYPTWITRHGANGIAYFSPPGPKVLLSVRNTMNYVGDANNENRIVSNAIRTRRLKLEKQIQQTVAANFRKARRQRMVTR